MVWWLAALSLMAVNALLVGRWGRGGLVTSVVLTYVFLQGSSFRFLVPWYKDGGDGALVGGWWIWAAYSLVLVGLCWFVVRLTRWVAR